MPPVRRPAGATRERTALAWLPSLLIACALAAPARAQAPAYLVRDIVTSASEVESSAPGHLVQVGETTFFVASTPQTGSELWKSDATEAGTVLVKDLRPGLETSSPRSLVAAGDTLFFTVGNELWKSNGTHEGTTVLLEGLSTQSLVAVDHTLFFIVDHRSARELWKSDGTAEGTVLLIGISRPPVPPIPPASLAAVDGTLFFTVGGALWKSDGTASGTLLVKQIPGGVPASL